MNITFGSVTDRGLNVRRTVNEDNLLTLPDQGLFIVADGVGGHRGGQIASQIAVDVFREAFETGTGPDLVRLVRETIVKANQEIFRRASENPDLNGMASTLALIACDDSTVVIAHVGDSRVYSFDGSQLRQETEDHSEVNEALRAGRITPEEAAHHPNKNIISRALGADATVEPEIRKLALLPHTSFLLCTDGITRHIPDKELEDLLRSKLPPSSICSQLKSVCFSRGAEDNLTAILIDIGERTYVEEATHPVVSHKPTGAAAFSSPSRISVDFTAESDGAAGNAKPGSEGSKSLKRLASNLLSWSGTALVLVAIGAAVWYGYSRRAEVWTSLAGRPAISPSTGPVANADFKAAQALIEEKRWEKARESFSVLVQKSPENFEYRLYLGRALFELNDLDGASKQLAEASKLNGKSPEVLQLLAKLAEKKGDKKAAADYRRRAAELVPVSSPMPSPAG